MVEARGVAVANVLRAKVRGLWVDWEKSMDEKVMPPEETSGTRDMVSCEG